MCIEDGFISFERAILDDHQLASLQTCQLLPTPGIDLVDTLADGMHESFRNGGWLIAKRDQSQRERHPMKSRNPNAFDVRLHE